VKRPLESGSGGSTADYRLVLDVWDSNVWPFNDYNRLVHCNTPIDQLKTYGFLQHY